MRDRQGAVYLRYHNHKMRRDAVVPIDDELNAMITTQQARTRQRFPTTSVLLPRSTANPDGRLPIATATFHRQLGIWLETCGSLTPRTTGTRHRPPIPARQPLGGSTTTCRRKWSGACSTTPAAP